MKICAFKSPKINLMHKFKNYFSDIFLKYILFLNRIILLIKVHKYSIDSKNGRNNIL